MADFIMTYLDPLGVVVGLVISVPVFWTWWDVVFGERRRRRKWLAEIAGNPGQRPGVLIVDLLPERDIVASVKRFLASHAELSSLPQDRIVRVSRNEALIPDRVVGLARDLRSAVRKLYDAGCDVIHLFHAGPDVSALIAGAELSNGPRVMLYHYEQGEYRCFGPLEPLR